MKFVIHFINLDFLLPRNQVFHSTRCIFVKDCLPVADVLHGVDRELFEECDQFFIEILFDV
jgi:hypothetical protein